MIKYWITREKKIARLFDLIIKYNTYIIARNDIFPAFIDKLYMCLRKMDLLVYHIFSLLFFDNTFTFFLRSRYN